VFLAVSLVANNRKPEVLEVNANLMRAACVQARGHERGAAQTLDNFITRPGLASVGTTAIRLRCTG